MYNLFLDVVQLRLLDRQRLRKRLITVPQDPLSLPSESITAQNLDPLVIRCAESKTAFVLARNASKCVASKLATQVIWELALSPHISYCEEKRMDCQSLHYIPSPPKSLQAL